MLETTKKREGEVGHSARNRVRERVLGRECIEGKPEQATNKDEESRASQGNTQPPVEGKEKKKGGIGVRTLSVS